MEKRMQQSDLHVVSVCIHLGTAFKRVIISRNKPKTHSQLAIENRYNLWPHATFKYRHSLWKMTTYTYRIANCIIYRHM